MTRRPGAPTWLLLVLLLAAPAAARAGFIGELEFLGEAVVASGARFADTEIGGLSALLYDPASGRFLALSDDPAATDPARLYTLSIELADSRLSEGDVEVVGLTFLSDRNGEPFEPFTIDGEGLAPAPGGHLFISSEGNIERGAAPFLREIERNGSWRRDLRSPRRYRPRPDGRAGVRHNLVFEGLTTTPSGRWLFVGLENALAQDGPAADLDTPSPSRILRFNAANGRLAGEYLYWVDPVPLVPPTADGFRVNGLVELLALDDDHLLALERCYTAGVGNSIRLYEVDLGAADEIGRRPLARRAARVRAAAKTLMVDFADLGVELDNIEGLTFGPTLPDGRRTLVLVSDNNFNPRQRTQFLAFGWRPEVVPIPAIQGRAQLSPLVDRWLFGLGGVVTAIDPHPERGGFWLQDGVGDDDPATSDAIFVAAPGAAVEERDVVHAGGRVSERARRGELPVTRLERAIFEVVGRSPELPAPVVLGPQIPRAIDDDGLEAFEPATDAIDYFESLEGMRVEITAPLVVGPTSRFGDFVVVAGAGSGLDRRTARGGLLIADDDPRPQRLQVDSRLAPPGSAVDLAVGTRLDAPIRGVVDYSFGSFEVVATELPPPRAPSLDTADPTALVSTPTGLTIATYNVENLDARDSDEKYERVATVIVRELASPDILALQEIQDDSGSEDDGTVSAGATLGRLLSEVARLGGPRYEFHQIDPLDGADGGQPGANIRVAFLVNPARVYVPERGTPAADTAVDVVRGADGPYLVPNPGRIAPTDPAFAADEPRGFEASRKPLALEARFGDRTLFLVNVHLKSKRGDDALFGSTQPPARASEVQRGAQAEIVHQFVARLLLADPNAAVVVLGDVNDFEFRPPLATVAGRLLVNLIELVAPAERYTYIYQGLSQVLDHVLASPALVAGAQPEADVVHVNADQPVARRASDHDPVVVRLELGR